HGKVLLVEMTLAEDSPVVGKVVGEVNLPRDTSLVAIVRAGHVIAPRDETPLMVGDEVLALATAETMGELELVLSGTLTRGSESSEEFAEDYSATERSS
ncbi:MAG: TrkA C-terminal domain-containing protein, partial [Actinomycetota bacterium]